MYRRCNCDVIPTSYINVLQPVTALARDHRTTSVTSRRVSVCAGVTSATGSVTAVWMGTSVSPTVGRVNVTVTQTPVWTGRAPVYSVVITP